MPATSLVKYMEQQNGGGRGSLHWGRADVDQAPFRGPAPLIASEDEYESRVTRINDAKNRTFDTSDPEENTAYLQVIDRIANGWYTPVHRHHEHVVIKEKVDGIVRIRLKVLVYLEWLEPYMEDGKPHLSQRPNVGRSNADV